MGMTSLQAKVMGFNLLSLTPTLQQYIIEICPMLTGQDLTKFDYVKFFMGEPYFYTEKYVKETPTELLHKAFMDIIDEKYNWNNSNNHK